MSGVGQVGGVFLIVKLLLPKTFLVVSKCMSDNYQKNMFFSVITFAALFGASNAIGHRSEIATPENHTREEFVGKLM